MTLIIFDPVSPRLEALAERAKTSTEADARAAQKMGEVIQLQQPVRPTECPVCGGDIEPYPAMVEVFETLGHLVCEDCHEGELEQWAEDHSQFGMGA